MAQVKKQFTIPVVCNYDGDLSKEWFIFFRFFQAGKWHVFKRREGINRYHKLRERQTEADQLRKAREDWLKMGWNPVLDPEFKSRDIMGSKFDLSNLKAMELTKAMIFALEKRQLAPRSKECYGTTVRYINKAAEKLGIDSMPISQLTKVHCKALISEARDLQGKFLFLPLIKTPGQEHRAKLIEKKKWGAKAYNKNLTYFKALVSELVDWEMLEYNPAFKMPNVQEEETIKFIPLTIEEKNIVREYLKLIDPAFLQFITVMYHTGIRPKEILGLQIKDFNEKDGYFHLLPFSEKTKTKKERKVAINPHLMNQLKKMNLQKFDKDFYIFSEGFLPGEKRVARIVATDLWDAYVRNHLGIDKFMYCMKHTGADDLIEAGEKKGIQNIEEMVQNHLGHSSKFMTRRYTQKGLELSRKVISNISPQF